MSDYTATVVWQREDTAAFTGNTFSRARRWLFDDGARVPASSSPQGVPVPLSYAAAVDLEETSVRCAVLIRPAV